MIVYLLYATDHNCVLLLKHLGHFIRLLHDVIMFTFDTYTLTHYTVYTE